MMLRLCILLVLCAYSAWGQPGGNEVCCDEIPGLCFNDDPPFDHLPLPVCPDEIDVNMEVYTRSNPNNGQTLDRDTIPPAWDSGRRTLLMVHGWLGSSDHSYMHTMKDAWLERGDYNVILVGWEESSQQIWYPASAADTRSVGAHIAAVYDNLMQNGGAAAEDFYCVGHSLGSHVCGHTGAHTQSLFGFTIGRISGLDPAGPLFEGVDWEVGLNPTCADFVDAMHTHGEPNVILNLGTMKVLGHVDFYPNEGDTQPGCILDPLELDDDDMTPACSHMRAVHYYIESINTNCFLSRNLCSDQYDLPGSCTSYPNAVQAMGMDAEDNQYMDSGIFWLETNSATPFCQG